LKDGRKVDFALCDAIIQEELEKAKKTADPERYTAYEKSAQLMRDMIRAPQFIDFLTVPAYGRLLQDEKNAAAA
jgi:malate synthase